MQNILITGGTGLVGGRLTTLLHEKGYQVAHLSRKHSENNPVNTFVWDIQKGIIEEEALTFPDHIIHLAGANVADRRWTEERKKVILKSRTKSANLLFEKLHSTGHHVQTFVSASAVGIYGIDNGDRLITENSKYGNDFLANVTKAWEACADQMNELGIRVVKLRVGIVLSDKGGALKALSKPIRLGAGAPLGSGEQYMSWIHIDDLCNMFVKAIEDTDMHGAYNAVAPNPVTNETMTEKVAEVLNKPLLLPNVPAFVLKLLLGERASFILGGSKVSSAKMESTGFQYKFPGPGPALEDLLK